MQKQKKHKIQTKDNSELYNNSPWAWSVCIIN